MQGCFCNGRLKAQLKEVWNKSVLNRQTGQVEEGTGQKASEYVIYSFRIFRSHHTNLPVSADSCR